MARARLNIKFFLDLHYHSKDQYTTNLTLSNLRHREYGNASHGCIVVLVSEAVRMRMRPHGQTNHGDNVSITLTFRGNRHGNLVSVSTVISSRSRIHLITAYKLSKIRSSMIQSSPPRSLTYAGGSLVFPAMNRLPTGSPLNQPFKRSAELLGS